VQKFEAFATDFIQMNGNKTGPISPIITQSAAFGYASCAEAEGIFDGSVKKPLYARMGNPTTAQLERLLAHMEGGVGAIATASGMGAISLAVISMTQAGDEIISIGGLFGGTYGFFHETLSRFGIVTHFLSADAMDTLHSVITPKTKILFLESVGNPNMRLPDITAIATIAQEHGIALMVDNTVTPITLQPLKLGADIVVYSTTKIIAGNASVLGGAAIFRAIGGEGDKFRSPRYAFLSKFIEKMGENALIGMGRKRALRDLGMSASAFSSYLTLLGLETLPFRMPRSIENVRTVALALHAAGLAVNHPALPHHPDHARFLGLFDGSCGTLLTLDFGTKARAFAFLDASKLITITANIADSRTLGLHMASTIYRDFSAQDRAFLGITDGLVRISIGLESPQAIIDDFLEAYTHVH